MATATEAAAATATAFWAERAGARLADITASTAQQAVALWADFADWYTPGAIAERALEAANLSLIAQETVAQMMAAYVAEVTAATRGSRKVPVPKIVLPPVRNGVDLLDVHARTAKAYRIEYAKEQSVEDAIAAAFLREQNLIAGDLVLASREAQVEAMRDLDVTHYRRVIRPELSESGTCGLCLAASLNLYTVAQLMPIHPPTCKCLTAPVIGGVDPAQRINEEDRQAIYKELGETDRTRLSNTRIDVQEHGEYGPVLTVKGQEFTGPSDLADKGSGSGGSGGSGGRTASGDDPDEYDDTAVPFRPSERPRVGPRQRQHILDGDADGTGGHRFGTGRPGKTEFPETWDDETVLGNIDATIERPGQILIRGDKVVFRRDFDGIVVHVAVRVDLDPPEIWNAYPLPDGSTL